MNRRPSGAWAKAVERTEEFSDALKRAQAEKGVRLLHLKTDLEYITAATTIARLREKSKA